MEFRSHHAGDILSNLNSERTSSRNFCDFTIKAGKEEFAIHKCVVGTFSKFFKNLLTTEMKEKYSKEVTVQFSPAVVELVINFIYTSCVKISMDSVYEVLEASEFLEIPFDCLMMVDFLLVCSKLLGDEDLKDCCEKVLKKYLNVGNCLEIRAITKLYQMQKVTEMAESFICDNLSSVLEIEEFFDLAVDDVRSLLEMENKQQTIDECKYKSLVKWTKHDIDNRGSSFSSLFTLIDLEWLSKNFINTVVLKEKLVQDSFECMSRFITLVALHAPEVLHENTEKQSYSSAKAKQVEDILLIGGEECPHSVIKYNLNSKQFSDMPNTIISRDYPSALNYLGRIFLMGGCNDDGATFNSVEILNLNESTLKWEINQTSMIVDRESFGSALLNDVIYCAGGTHQNRHWSSVEGYDLKIGKWSRKNKMNEARRFHGLVSTQGMLFAIGGFDHGNEALDTAEVFNLNVGNWRYIPSMKTCRGGLCAVVLNQEIYAIGGHGGRYFDGNVLSSVEKYNLASQRWSAVASMKEERSGGSACVVNGKIYVFGGFPANTVQSYDPTMNEWFIEADMDKERSYLSVVSI